MDDFLFLSDREYFAMFGTLPASRIEPLLRFSDKESLSTGRCKDAIASFPDEDFLQQSINDLYSYVKMSRPGSALNTRLRLLLSQLENLQNEVNQSSEYGRDELNRHIADIDTYFND